MNRDTPLPSCRLLAGTAIAQAAPWVSEPATLMSPATAVMTDLTKVKAATVLPGVSLRQAERYMTYLGVHMLFVVGQMPALDGLITSTDLHGERPLQVSRQRGTGFDELTVSDVMTGVAQIDAIDLDLLRMARVSNVIATLKRRGRNHLLVVDTPPGVGMRVRGVISRSQVERQLGEQVDVIEVACNFAEIARMLA